MTINEQVSAISSNHDEFRRDINKMIYQAQNVLWLCGCADCRSLANKLRWSVSRPKTIEVSDDAGEDKKND
jgi:hypothetical protein